MNILDDSENNAKVSDSAYSTSCSNSHSRRSHSSKSTHSGSHSSQSSGYGGKQSPSESSNLANKHTDKRSIEKNGKNKQDQTEREKIQDSVEFRLPDPAPLFEIKKEVFVAGRALYEASLGNIKTTKNSPPRSASSRRLRGPNPGPSTTTLSQAEMGIENMDTATEMGQCENTVTIHTAHPQMQVILSKASSTESFLCVIAMHDGIVMYTTSSLTSTLGYPTDMWVGRSFIEFIHPLDRSTFTSQITNGFAVPENVNDGLVEGKLLSKSGPTMFCRIRRYKGLQSSFCMTDTASSYTPLKLKLSFKNFIDEKGLIIYLVVQATPLFSAFKTAHEMVVKPESFFMRHVSNGILEYIDHKSVPFLGFLPQDIIGKDILHLYHPDDLVYVKQVYETIVKAGGAPRTKPYRLMAHNGQYLKVETEWSSFVNPWSRKLEFVIGKHHIVQGPADPDVFLPPFIKVSNVDINKTQGLRDSILRIMDETLTKPAELAKQQITKRCQDLTSYMENLTKQPSIHDDELRLEIQEHGNTSLEHDSVMLGGLSPHHDNVDCKSSTAATLSYYQLNFNENLERYFAMQQVNSYEEYLQTIGVTNAPMTSPKPYIVRRCLSPMADHSGDSAELTSSGESAVPVSDGKCCRSSSSRNYKAPLRLTESILNRHNSEMEKTLVMQHRECQASSKECIDKASNETKQNIMNHLGRCDAYFVPTPADAPVNNNKPLAHGVKRALDSLEEEASAHKHHCAAPQFISLPNTTPAPSYSITTSAAQWHYCRSNQPMNLYLPSMSPHPVTLLNPMAAVPGLIPTYGFPPAGPPMPSYAETPTTTNPNILPHVQPQPGLIPTYGFPPAGPPMPSYAETPTTTNPTILPHVQPQPGLIPTYGFPLAGPPMPSYAETPTTTNPNILPHVQPQSGLIPTYGFPPAGPPMPSYAETPTTTNPTILPHVQPQSVQCMMYGQPVVGTPVVVSPVNPQMQYHHVKPQYAAAHTSLELTTSNYEMSTEPVSDTSSSRVPKVKGDRIENVNAIRIDGESSYSSFYSSFFKTEGSAEDSSNGAKDGRLQSRNSMNSDSLGKNLSRGRVLRRKREPPWMEQVCETPNLVYKYQLLTKSMEEVLLIDKQKLALLKQPPLVNEQLGQLYMELELQGAAARVTVEEGITSSSSGDDTGGKSLKDDSRAISKSDCNKLWMMYEDDAPLPSPEEPNKPNEPVPSSPKGLEVLYMRVGTE